MSDKTDGRTVRYAHRRTELLHAVTEHVLDAGLADLTLRRVASAIGVSHATLVHHFATRDQLIAEIVDDVLTRILMPSARGIAAGFDLRATWAWLQTPEGSRATRLYLSISGLALYGDPPYAAALRRSQEGRLAALSEGLRLVGCPPHESQAVATTVLARVRGLAADLLLTGDTDRVDLAFEEFLRDAVARSATWTRPPQSG